MSAGGTDFLRFRAAKKVNKKSDKRRRDQDYGCPQNRVFSSFLQSWYTHAAKKAEVQRARAAMHRSSMGNSIERPLRPSLLKKYKPNRKKSRRQIIGIPI